MWYHGGPWADGRMKFYFPRISRSNFFWRTFEILFCLISETFKWGVEGLCLPFPWQLGTISCAPSVGNGMSSFDKGGTIFHCSITSCAIKRVPMLYLLADVQPVHISAFNEFGRPINIIILFFF